MLHRSTCQVWALYIETWPAGTFSLMRTRYSRYQILDCRESCPRMKCTLCQLTVVSHWGGWHRSPSSTGNSTQPQMCGPLALFFGKFARWVRWIAHCINTAQSRLSEHFDYPNIFTKETSLANRGRNAVSVVHLKGCWSTIWCRPDRFSARKILLGV